MSFLTGQLTLPAKNPPQIKNSPSGPVVPALHLQDHRRGEQKDVPTKVLSAVELKKWCKEGRTKGESDSVYFGRVSQLHLEGRGLTRMPTPAENSLFHSCGKLRSLFLDENHLSVLENIGFAKRLYHLYAKSNRLELVMDLATNKYLERVFLDDNCISLLDTIFPPSLIELYVTRQRIADPRAQLSFSAETSHSLAGLRVLDIRGNNISSLQFLHPLVSLVELNASENNLQDLREIGVLCGELSSLEKLDFTKNPVCKHKDYRVHVLLGAMRVWELDGKEVAEKERFYLRRRYLGPPAQQQTAKPQQGQQRDTRGGRGGSMPKRATQRKSQPSTTGKVRAPGNSALQGLLTSNRAPQHNRKTAAPSFDGGSNNRFILSNGGDQTSNNEYSQQSEQQLRYQNSLEELPLAAEEGEEEEGGEVFIPPEFRQSLERPQAANSDEMDSKVGRPRFA